MRDDSWQDVVKRQVLGLQIIVGALVAGVLFFLVIVLFVRPPTNLLASAAPGVLTLVAVSFAGLLLILRPLVLRILGHQSPPRTARRPVSGLCATTVWHGRHRRRCAGP